MPSDVTDDESDEIVKLLTSMRLAAGIPSFAEAERIGPMTRQWVSGLEQEGRGDVGPVVYLFRLARRTPLARSVFATALGTTIPDTDDPELRLLSAQIATAWDDPRKRKALRKGIEALFEAMGERGEGEQRAAG